MTTSGKALWKAQGVPHAEVMEHLGCGRQYLRKVMFHTPEHIERPWHRRFAARAPRHPGPRSDRVGRYEGRCLVGGSSPVAWIETRGKRIYVYWRRPDGTRTCQAAPDRTTAKRIELEVERAVAVATSGSLPTVASSSPHGGDDDVPDGAGEDEVPQHHQRRPVAPREAQALLGPPQGHHPANRAGAGTEAAAGRRRRGTG